MEVTNANSTYDLIVIGAGPAGCAAAMTAARTGASVLLLERGTFPRHKVCGEFVSAESLELLESLLTTAHRSLIARAPRIAQSRIFADGAEIPAEITPAAASITRFDLDHALWDSCLQNGVHARQGCTVQAIQRTALQPDGANRSATAYVVKTSSGPFEARSLINASGRWSSLTSADIRTRVGDKNDRWIGLKCHFREMSAPPSVDLYFFEGGYCGVQPITSPCRSGYGAVVNACAMVKASVAANLQQALRGHPALRERSQSWQPLMDPVSTSPLIFHEPEPLRDGMLQVGDSATFVDPFIGDGISLALRSGSLAARCLVPAFRGERRFEQAAADYAMQYMERLAPVFRASSRLRNLMRWPMVVRKPVMSVLQRTPRITKQLVRMTR